MAAMTEAVMTDLAAVRALAGETEALVGLETFVAIALRVMEQTNPSKLREVMRLVEIQARMDGKHVFE